MNVAMMSRDTGESFHGELYGDGSGSGRMTVTMNGVNCSGPASRVASDQRTIIASSFGYNNKGTTASSFGTATISGDTTVTALLSCSDGKGMRCEFKGQNLHGGGTCTINDGRTFDFIVSPQ
jgi:hypothetical protein